MSDRPYYNRVLAYLEDAHKACFNHQDRPLLGMSHGPFAGVNEALGIVATLERENAALKAENAALREEIEELKDRVDGLKYDGLR